MYYLYAITGIAIVTSFLGSRQRTKMAVIIAIKRFGNILSPVLIMLMIISCLTVRVSDSGLLRYIGHENTWIGVATALLLGSVTMMPGFIVFPLCGIFSQRGGIVAFSEQSKWGLKAMLLASYLSLIAISGFLDFEPGKQIGQNFLSFAMAMLPLVIITSILLEPYLNSITIMKQNDSK